MTRTVKIMETWNPKSMKKWKRGTRRSWKAEKKTDPTAPKTYPGAWFSPSDGMTVITPAVSLYLNEKDWMDIRMMRKVEKELRKKWKNISVQNVNYDMSFECDCC